MAMVMNRKLQEGDVIEGQITGIQPYGIFVKLTHNCSGLVHATELDRFENANTNRFFKVGQPLKVKILKIKPGGEKAILRINRTAKERQKIGASNFETTSGFVALKKQMATWVAIAKENADL